jgi:hypothetical protein
MHATARTISDAIAEAKLQSLKVRPLLQLPYILLAIPTFSTIALFR